MKRAVVLNCSCIIFTSGHPKRRSQEEEKEEIQIIINQQNRKKGKAGGLRGTRVVI